MTAHNRCRFARYFIYVCIVVFCSPLSSFDQPYFYRANYFLGEPRFEKDVLTSFDLIIAGGTANHARNTCGTKKVYLFDIYGLHNMHDLGVNIPASSNKLVNQTLDNLANIENQSTDSLFGYLSFKGKFHLFEAILNLYQNLTRGFFYQVTIPIKSINTDEICSCDLSQSPSAGTPNSDTPAWTTFLDQFDSILTAYNLNFDSQVESSGPGDIGVYFGWTRNYQETKYLDFVDFTIKAGILAPSAKVRNEDLLFDIPLGNNGHIGFPVYGAVSIGLYEWITTGFYLEGIFFHDHNLRYRRMKTAEKQSGMIKLYKGCAKEHKGTLWDFTLFAKADHMPGPLSFLLGYSYTHKRRDYLTPQDTNVQETIVNTDPQLWGWTMHTIHLELEWDFTEKENVLGPHLAALINIPVRGKNIFDTTMFGLDIGIDCSWNF